MELPPHTAAVVIGAGSAGLSTSRHLSKRGVAHIVVERAKVGDAWASRRWDSFTLVTPNWSFKLPDFPYEGPDQDGFLPRDEIVARLEAYAAKFELPVRTGIDVRRLSPTKPAGPWALKTSAGSVTADNVVVATGAFPEPRVATTSRALTPRVLQLHTSQYRRPSAMPEGAVLVVGSGQSGVQIAEELLEAGRTVFLSIGTCPRAPRRYRGRDTLAWAAESGFFDQPRSALPSPKARLSCNPQVTGRDGGHDVNVWTLARRGMALLGRFIAADGERLQFADDVQASLHSAEAATRKFLGELDAYIARVGATPPPADLGAFDFSLPPQPRRTTLDLASAGVCSVIWATGFRPSYPWIEGCAFDADGFPITERGVTPSAGLYFVGVHFLHVRKSGLLLGVGEDAEHVANHIASRRSG